MNLSQLLLIALDKIQSDSHLFYDGSDKRREEERCTWNEHFGNCWHSPPEDRGGKNQHLISGPLKTKKKRK